MTKQINVTVPDWVYESILKSKKNKSSYILGCIIKDAMILKENMGPNHYLMGGLAYF